MLSGVPETALWTLYHRAIAARQGVLDDPQAIELVDKLDHPFVERFGGEELAAWQGLRVRAFDRSYSTWSPSASPPTAASRASVSSRRPGPTASTRASSPRSRSRTCSASRSRAAATPSPASWSRCPTAR
jgi:hypothetical protein